jgi:hypothetical protein
VANAFITPFNTQTICHLKSFYTQQHCCFPINRDSNPCLLVLEAEALSYAPGQNCPILKTQRASEKLKVVFFLFFFSVEILTFLYSSTFAAMLTTATAKNIRVLSDGHVTSSPRKHAFYK